MSFSSFPGTRGTCLMACLAIAATLCLGGSTAAIVPSSAWNTITPEALLRHIRVLSSDDFEGRGPATRGEQKTVEYLIEQCKQMKLQPGNPDGTWVQKVHLWGITGNGGELSVRAAGKPFPFDAADYRLSSAQPKEVIEIPDSKIVFVGYGIVAPEFHWDDYKGVDVKGKLVVYLGGDPPIPDPTSPNQLDSKMFLGPELSFYGRPGTKSDIAFAKGASAVMTITGGPNSRFPTRPPGANGGPNRFINHEIMIVRDDSSTKHIAAAVSLNNEKAVNFFRAAGQDLNALREAAVSRHFRPVPLNASLSGVVRNSVREIESDNVIAKITGADPKLRDEVVVYSGHWDHLGKQGDNIYHGASDNASGAAGVLELAHAFTALPEKPRRTVLFLWPTAEEKGLLGAKYYVQHPLYPLTKTVANINLDYFSNWGWGRTKDFSILSTGSKRGEAMSTLEQWTKEAVARQGRVVTGDTDPVEGFYWRSDHVEFAMAGVPSLGTSPGIEHIGKPSGFGEQMRREFITSDYHKPTDQIKSGWDLTGSVEDLQVLFEVGYRAAESGKRPVWTHRPPFMHSPYAGK
jgi:Zn-dependent M28 family amino/carboxypeptidase